MLKKLIAMLILSLLFLFGGVVALDVLGFTYTATTAIIVGALGSVISVFVIAIYGIEKGA